MTRGERLAQLKAENRAAMQRFLGAVMCGLWVKYWPPANAAVEAPLVLDARPLHHWTGFRGVRRGRHWDRRRR